MRRSPFHHGSVLASSRLVSAEGVEYKVETKKIEAKLAEADEMVRAVLPANRLLGAYLPLLRACVAAASDAPGGALDR